MSLDVPYPRFVQLALLSSRKPPDDGPGTLSVCLACGVWALHDLRFDKRCKRSLASDWCLQDTRFQAVIVLDDLQDDHIVLLNLMVDWLVGASHEWMIFLPRLRLAPQRCLAWV
ncbi:hypothetical protein HRR77_008025 [Exophiala dermatitidis]|nr:hypothetical protein HRR77_008025 [Exophiala dermatitidis]